MSLISSVIHPRPIQVAWNLWYAKEKTRTIDSRQILWNNVVTGYFTHQKAFIIVQQQQQKYEQQQRHLPRGSDRESTRWPTRKTCTNGRAEFFEPRKWTPHSTGQSDSTHVGSAIWHFLAAWQWTFIPLTSVDPWETRKRWFPALVTKHQRNRSVFHSTWCVITSTWSMGRFLSLARVDQSKVSMEGEPRVISMECSLLMGLISRICDLTWLRGWELSVSRNEISFMQLRLVFVTVRSLWSAGSIESRFSLTSQRGTDWVLVHSVLIRGCKNIIHSQQGKSLRRHKGNDLPFLSSHSHSCRASVLRSHFTECDYFHSRICAASQLLRHDYPFCQ